MEALPTINHLKWNYIDAINSGVQEAILFVFGRLPKKYWHDQHQEALKMALDHILNKERVVEFKPKSLVVIISHHYALVLTMR
jgi:hypothetical protein